jgi:hypothetical protein
MVNKTTKINNRGQKSPITYADLILAATVPVSVSQRAGTIPGPLGVTILAVSILSSGNLAVLALACSCLAILLTAGVLILAAIDAVLIAASCSRRWAISILCCQGKTGQQA